MNPDKTYALDEKLSIWLVSAMFAIPFAIGYHIIPITSFYNEIAAFMLGLLALYPLLLNKNWQPLKVAKVNSMWLGLISLIILQYQLELIPTRSQALTYVFYMLWAAMLTMLGTLHQRQFALATVIRRLSVMIIGVAWFNVFYVGLQLLQKYGVYEPTFMLAGSFGAISQANHFASFNALALASLIYLHGQQTVADNEKSWKKAIVQAHFYGALLAFAVMLTTSGSRSAWLYLLILFALSLWLAFRQPAGRVRQLAVKACMITLLLLPLFALLQLVMAEVAQGYVTTAAERLSELTDQHTVGGIKMRLYMWQQSLHLFMQQPWLGFGFAQSRAATYATLDDALPQGMQGAYENPHNLLIQLLAETGVIGMLIVLVPLLFWLAAVIKKPENPEKWWNLSIIGIFAIHSMLEYPLSFAYYLGFAAYLMGLTQTAAWDNSRFAAARQVIKYTVSLLLALGMLVSLHTFHAYHKLDHWIRILMQHQFNAQHMDGYYETVSWLNRKSLLAAYSYPMFLLAIEHLPIDSTGKQAVNELSLKILPMPKSAYMQPLYLLQQQKNDEALHAMKLALQSFPEDYQDRLKSVPPLMRAQYEALYQQAWQSMQPQP